VLPCTTAPEKFVYGEMFLVFFASLAFFADYSLFLVLTLSASSSD
jgi:hypothetical protein